MNTPAHLLIGAAAMGRGKGRGVIWAALAGALLPDVSLYLMAGVSIWVLSYPPQIVFNEFYFSDAWMSVFAIDNSFVLWGFALSLAIWKRSAWAIALTGAALLHLALDFPLHHDDGRPHFWPLSWWIFDSPVSYWHRGHGATWVSPLEVMLAMGSAIILWLRKPGWILSGITLALLIAELMVARVWMFVFASG